MFAKHVFFTALALAALSLAGCEKDEEATQPDVLKKEQLVDVGGYRLNIRMAGDEGPSVVLISGIESPLQIWEEVQKEAGLFSQVLAYDRGGYAKSDTPAGPRDGVTVADELHRLLRARDLPAPYILVAHSLGGPIARIFAGKYPTEVAGVVLADCTSDAELAITAGLPPELFDDLQFAGSREELRAVSTTIDQLGSGLDLPDLPLIVITNMKPAPNETPETREWAYAEQGKWLLGKTNAKQWRTDGGHEVPLFDPAVILLAIREITGK